MTTFSGATVRGKAKQNEKQSVSYSKLDAG